MGSESDADIAKWLTVVPGLHAELTKLRAENARLREGCEHSLIALDGRMPELARRIRDALKGKGT